MIYSLYNLVSCLSNLRYRGQKKIIRNEYTRMIEDTGLCSFGSRPDLPYLNVRYPIYDQKLVIERQLSIREFYSFKIERYADKDGWVLSRYAYLLTNMCPDCGQPLYASFQSSPAYTWKRLCGRAGILVYCTHCHADLNFFLTAMN